MDAQTNLDPVAVATLAASVLVGPAAAQVVGPYAVIIVAALTGAAWSLTKRPPEPALSAIWFMCRIVFTAALLTVGITSGLETWFLKEVKWLLVPVAFGIGWIGDDWPKVFKWIGRRVRRVADDRFIDRRSKEEGGQDETNP